MKVETIIANLKPELTRLINTHKGKIEALQEKVGKIIEVSSVFDQNWAGSWASPAYNFYYDIITKNGKSAISEEEIQEYIENKSGVSLNEVQKTIPSIAKEYREFHEKLLTELAIIKTLENLEPEIELLNKIEVYEWGMAQHDYIKLKTPKTVYTYNPEILLNRGMDTPPHIVIGGELMSLFTHLISFIDFQKISSRLLRQLEIKFSIEDSSLDKSEFLLKLINNFHTVASQLRNRYDNRTSLIIEDEYDVQDLLHGMLKIEFDDIRPEEYTPSYAGSSTRMDFLLKKEKIIIEVKKTRQGLRDREVGDQLILDIQHYKAHPDCKRLICFVYDPENRIKNLRGLESDLMDLSTDNLIVEIYIRP